jgi:hypothetical protein
MSRILRRPMFRGGRVSSYGTGIAAPLVPGYKVVDKLVVELFMVSQWRTVDMDLQM